MSDVLDRSRGRGRPSVEAKPPARKEREKQRHRLEVGRAAEALLLTKGLHEITMQEIAEEAEFSVGYLYRLFANKDELFAEVIRRKHEELHSLLVEEIARPGDSVRERLSNAVERVFLWLKDNVGYAAHSHMDFALFVQSHPELRDDLQARNDRTTRRMVALFRKAIDRGELAAPDAETISDTFGALMWGFIHQSFQERMKQGSPGIVDRTGKEKDWSDYAPLIVSVILRAFAPSRDRG